MPLSRIGEITVDDLSALCHHVHGDQLPYPFTGGTDAITEVTADLLEDRLRDGDLAVFRPWLAAYQSADIWVASRTHPGGVGGTERQILAYRAGEAGYLALRYASETVAVHSLSALALGPAIAQLSGLAHPGAHARVTVPKYVGYFAGIDPAGRAAAAEYEDEDDISVTVAAAPGPAPTRSTVLADAAITGVTTVQSTWRPPRRWGIDWSRSAVVWISVDNDGDYIYAPDYTVATPLDTATLADRVNRLIAEDVRALRHSRSG